MIQIRPSLQPEIDPGAATTDRVSPRHDPALHGDDFVPTNIPLPMPRMIGSHPHVAGGFMTHRRNMGSLGVILKITHYDRAGNTTETDE